MTKKSKTPTVQWMNDGSSVSCPPWCEGELHSDTDHPDDRVHHSPQLWSFLPKLMNPNYHWPIKGEPGRFDHGPWEVNVYIQQGWREREPSIELVPDMLGSDMGKGLKLTIDEAKKLRSVLDEALALAEVRPSTRRAKLKSVGAAS
ncbi:hypothetical protein M8542_14350 [Amycolatopsis sp. OK19-0408]|uniref:Uncharacterized protein n=1 Tax=Amycolatopsis iheyensis TaxID=2945988 RepID=A0A9X2NA11_9PSEU|nr:hypothetical protein [Amycolatopsis iheyensis]MCR6484002.1 hypothetical protein [Amycolatopsis iheyensis]